MSVAEQTFQDVAAVAQDTYNYDNNMGDYDMMEAPVPLWRRRWVILAALALLIAVIFWVWRGKSKPKPKEEPAKTA